MQQLEQESVLLQGRLRAQFSPHLSIVVAWHTKTLSTAMNLLIEQDEANGWRPASVARGGGVPSGATRLDSARALILECRSQAEASLPVLCQSVDSVSSFADVICGIFKVLPRHMHVTYMYLFHAQAQCRRAFQQPERCTQGTRTGELAYQENTVFSS